MPFLIFNAGAAATVVNRLRAVDFQEDNHGQALFKPDAMGYTPMKPAIPAALECDDAKEGEFRLEVRTAVPFTDPAEYARRLATLRGVAITLEWSFRRARFPTVWRREWKQRSTRVTVDAAWFREHVVSQWRADAATAHLADAR